MIPRGVAQPEADFKVTRTPLAEQTIQQPENPQQVSAQNREVTEELELPIAAGSKVQQRGAEGTDLVVTMAEPGTLKRRHIERAGQSIGAAQKDTTRELSARLASMRPVQFAGVVLVLAALAMFHPAVRVITASATLQMVTGVTGLVLIFAPMVLAGHEGIILFAGLALVAVWFFVHRHGRLQGLVDALGGHVRPDGEDKSSARTSRVSATGKQEWDAVERVPTVSPASTATGKSEASSNLTVSSAPTATAPTPR